MKEILKELGITKSGTDAPNNAYVIDIDSYDEYGKFYSILEKNEDANIIEQIEDKSIISIHTTDVSYQYEKDDNIYEICLLGDLDQDIYKLVVTKY